MQASDTIILLSILGLSVAFSCLVILGYMAYRLLCLKDQKETVNELEKANDKLVYDNKHLFSENMLLKKEIFELRKAAADNDN